MWGTYRREMTGRDGESDGERCRPFDVVAPLVADAVHGDYEHEGDERLDEECLSLRESRVDGGHAQSSSLRLGGERLQRGSPGDGAHALNHHVERRPQQRHASRRHQPRRHGRVHVGAAHVPQSLQRCRGIGVTQIRTPTPRLSDAYLRDGRHHQPEGECDLHRRRRVAVAPAPGARTTAQQHEEERAQELRRQLPPDGASVRHLVQPQHRVRPWDTQRGVTSASRRPAPLADADSPVAFAIARNAHDTNKPVRGARPALYRGPIPPPPPPLEPPPRGPLRQLCYAQTPPPPISILLGLSPQTVNGTKRNAVPS